MTDDPDLESAYALSTPEDARRLYATWAASYDVDFGDGQGYLLPRHVAQVFLNTGGRGPVLDVGAGTGLVGEGLGVAGVGPVDGLDLSEDMLKVASGKGFERHLIAADVTQPLECGPYAGIVSAGTFTLGHVGPEGIAPLLDVALSGCVFVISVNAKHFEREGFTAFFAQPNSGVIDVQTEEVRIYSEKADLSHRYDMARIVTFRKA
jgi:SAM-dependent methyltransferase